MTNDEQLIAQSRSGSQDAYAALVQRYQRVVYATAHRITGDPHDAEDVAQETFVRAYFALDRFIPIRGGFPAWLVRIATNLSLTRLRRRRESPTEADERLPDLGPGPAEAAERDETREAVRRAVGELPDRYQTVVLLRFVQDLSYDEIAEEMGIPRNTVATWLRRALGLLEKSLGAVGPPGAAPVRGAGNGIASQIRAVGRVGR
ncbi:MAG: RNA polymerase sigma factor [Bacillota bacterium]